MFGHGRQSDEAGSACAASSGRIALQLSIVALSSSPPCDTVFKQ
jgi:hypothetical protein